MKKFKKIAIIGVGLIGGSIGLAVKKKGLAKEVVGIFRRRSTLAKAMKRRAIDWGTLDFEKGASGADLVIIATNVGTIPDMAKRAAPFMAKDGIITDVGSVKGSVTQGVRKVIPRTKLFVGSHPMAGSEKTGVENARPDMFEGAVTILTTTASTNRNALRRISEFWRRLGSSVSILTPKAHDEIVSMVSHLPHAAAVSLLLAQKKASLPFAAGGFKDYTRIASSETEMWLDILRNNRIAIIAALDVFMRELSAIRGDLFRKDTKALAGKLRKAKLIRDSIT